MKKDIQKWLCGAGVLSICVMLTGCGHEHIWAEATCTEPKTCSECGETEGEALGHTWEEATCTAPKTCSRCGETEGEALGHTWVEANYQAPKTCSVCDATEGEPMTASFEEHGLIINAEEGITYDYVTACKDDESKETIAHLTFSDYQISDTLKWNDGFPENYVTPEGYEWRSVHVTIVYDDENANNYGPAMTRIFTNYYDAEGFENSRHPSDEYDKWVYYTVNYYGVDYLKTDFSSDESDSWSGWVDETDTFEADYAFCVPVGYDGAVLAFHNYANRGAEIYWNKFDENTVFFRMD